MIPYQLKNFLGRVTEFKFFIKTTNIYKSNNCEPVFWYFLLLAPFYNIFYFLVRVTTFIYARFLNYSRNYVQTKNLKKLHTQKNKFIFYIKWDCPKQNCKQNLIFFNLFDFFYCQHHSPSHFPAFFISMFWPKNCFL